MDAESNHGSAQRHLQGITRVWIATRTASDEMGRAWSSKWSEALDDPPATGEPVRTPGCERLLELDEKHHEQHWAADQRSQPLSTEVKLEVAGDDVVPSSKRSISPEGSCRAHWRSRATASPWDSRGTRAAADHGAGAAHRPVGGNHCRPDRCRPFAPSCRGVCLSDRSDWYIEFVTNVSPLSRTGCLETQSRHEIVRSGSR